jgi:hypothetical protein
MVMDFHPWREGLYGFFGSSYKKVMKLFIHVEKGYMVFFGVHLQEGYETFHPFT